MTEEKTKLEDQLKSSQDLLSEKENTIVSLKQQSEVSEKNIADKEEIIANLNQGIEKLETILEDTKEQMMKEGKEKEVEYINELLLLKEGKNIIESKLMEALEKSIPDFYEVKKGDSLWKISEKFYNQGEKWIRIFEANIGKIRNPDLIYPYQRFTIPKG